MSAEERPAAEERLAALHRDLEACRACPKMIGPVVHGPPVPSRILLIGQAPGPREGSLGRPFAWTAGRTLFRWFEAALGVPEDELRRRVYMSAVARCFPGKAKGGGDRRPDPEEILRCRTHLAREVGILEPRLILPVGTLAVEQVLGHRGPLAGVIGEARRARFHGVEADVICLPHPSGASTWHKTEPGISLLGRALRLIAEHPEAARAFAGAAPAAAAASDEPP
ncbi:uracil-DNA glycosylase [Sorangium cellulosum]|uniref:Uracil-DNA glycosylase n=1 Tax=Sorangium cellulosum TaxID=56 RepID=A0A150TL35_SORCE|nr:uracil-DNA glycosylase [Sorangium cellulosum]